METIYYHYYYKNNKIGTVFYHFQLKIDSKISISNQVIIKKVRECRNVCQIYVSMQEPYAKYKKSHSIIEVYPSRGVSVLMTSKNLSFVAKQLNSWKKFPRDSRLW